MCASLAVGSGEQQWSFEKLGEKGSGHYSWWWGRKADGGPKAARDEKHCGGITMIACGRGEEGDAKLSKINKT